MHERLGALERLGSGVGVPDVAANHLDALGLELGGDVLLAVQQRVEHLHRAPGGQQLVDYGGSDVAGATRDRDGHRMGVPAGSDPPIPFGWKSAFSDSYSMMAFS